MKRHYDSEDQALADKLVAYADAIVALAFIVSSGLGLAIADPDSRGTFTDVAHAMIIGNAVLGVVFSILLVVLRRWELDLREGTPVSEKFRRYTRRINVARHVVIWLSVTQTIVTLAVIGD